MATQDSVLAIDLAAFSAQLLENREVSPRARIIAQAVTALFPAATVNVYLLATVEGDQVWAPQATAGEVTVHESAVPPAQGTLGMLATEARPFVLTAKKLAREEYSHLNVRRTLISLGYLPLNHRALNHQDQLLGAIEILKRQLNWNQLKLPRLEVPLTGALKTT